MVYFLCNSRSVSGRMKRAITRAALQFRGQETTLRQVTELGSYPVFFASLSPEDEVVFLGGDGTLNYFANATRGMEIRNPVYACKAGTGNDFLRDVLGHDAPDGTLYRINDCLHNLPLAEVNGREYVFFNNLAFGIDGQVCSVADDLKAKGRRRLNYTLIAARLLLHYRCPDAEITVDGVTQRLRQVWLAPTMNGRYFGGGMQMAPGQDRTADTVTLAAFHGSNRLKTISIFPQIFTGRHVRYTKYMTMLTGHDIHVVYSEPRDVQMDGEVVRDVTEYRVRKGAAIPAARAEAAEAAALV